MNYVLGKDGKLYIDGTAIASSANLDVAAKIAAATLVTNVQDVDTNLTKDTVEINSRANNGWKQKVGTLKDATISFNILWKPSDAGFALLKTAFLDDTEIFASALDGLVATAGSQGIAGNFNVTDFSRGEPIAGAMTAKVTLAPSSYTNWFTKA